LAVAASDAVEGCEQPLERPVRLVRLVVEDEVGKGYVEVVRELVGDRGGDVGEEALRVGAERSSSRCELEGGVLAAGEFELVDQVVEEAERVELGFLVGRPTVSVSHQSG